MKLAVAWAVCAGALVAQQRTVHISTPNPIVVSARTVQLSATLRDAQGNIVPNTTFNWSSNFGSVLTLDQNGLAKAGRPGLATVTAAAPGNVSATIQIEVVPLRIEVSPSQKIIKVGETVQYSARVLDANEQDIGYAVQWQTIGANGGQINAARMDGSGMLFTNAVAKVTVRAIASIPNVPGASGLISQFVGTAKLEIKPVDAYRITRLLASDEAPTSARLRLAQTQMAVSESGHLAFLANLDGYATGVVLYENGRLDVLASTGAPKPLYGGQINGFSGVSVNQRGQVLTYANTTNNAGIPSANALMLLSREGSRPLLINGSDSININNNAVSRYSLNDRGDAVFQASYAGSQALFRIVDGAVGLVWQGSADLPGLKAPLNFDDWGIDGTGDVYFKARGNFNVPSQPGQAYYRTDGFSTPTKIIAPGDTVAGTQVTGVQEFALSQSGEVVIQVFRNGDRAMLRIPKGAPQAQWQVLPVNCCGSIFAISAAGVLFSGSQGLYRWQGSSTTLAVQSSRLAPNGEPISSLPGAGITASGSVITQVSTASDYMFLRDGVVIADSKTRVDGPGLFSLGSLVPGAQTGPPHITMSGGSIFELDPLGLLPRVLFNDRLPDSTPGSAVGSARKSPAGDLYVNFSGRVFKIAGGQATYQFGNPPCDGNICVGLGGILGVHSNGAVLWSGGTNNGVQRLYLTRNNQHTLLTYSAGITGAAPGPAGGVVRNYNAMMDGQGRVMAWLTADPVSASCLALYENGAWQVLAKYAAPLLDLPEATSVVPFESIGDGFFLQIGSRYDGTLLARWRDGNWEKLIVRQDLAASGGQINGVQRVRANSRGDAAVLLQWNGNSGVVVRNADGSMRNVATLGDQMPDGSYVAEVVDFEYRDDGRVYLLIRDFDDRILLYVAEPL